jgi:hypothetical protein
MILAGFIKMLTRDFSKMKSAIKASLQVRLISGSLGVTSQGEVPSGSAPESSLPRFVNRLGPAIFAFSMMNCHDQLRGIIGFCEVI